MEQATYWMWAKTKPDLNPRFLTPPAAMNSYGDSWEEQAFAEDTAGTLGGCVWPPRSYSCSFCRREFRSAQALGGHMNVHRRDRARLKQSSNSPTEVVPQSACTFLYNNPNPEFSDSGPLVSPLSHVLRVSSPPTEDKEKTFTTLSFFSPISEKNGKGDIVSSNPPSWSSFLSEKRDHGLYLIKNDEKKSDVGVDQESRAQKEDCVIEDSSKSLNFFVCQTGNNASSDEEVGSCKRRRIEAKPLSFLPILSEVERFLPQSEALKLCSAGSTDDLDLELRLGDAPKVPLQRESGERIHRSI